MPEVSVVPEVSEVSEAPEVLGLVNSLLPHICMLDFVSWFLSDYSHNYTADAQFEECHNLSYTSKQQHKK